jgi:hypothetical protein
MTGGRVASGRWNVAVSIAVVGLGAFSGCNSGESAAQRSEVHPLGDSGGPTFGVSECAGCVASECHAEVTACSADPACAARWSCERRCPPGPNGNVLTSCSASCPDPGTPTGKRAFAALSACRISGPASGCAACGEHVTGTREAGVPDAGQIGDAGRPNPILNQVCAPSQSDAGACNNCKEAHCCETRAACNADPECNAFFDCLVACPKATVGECMIDCDAKGLPGYLKFNIEYTCVDLNCPAECEYQSPDPCSDCWKAHCLEPYTNCQSDAECSRFFQCLGACSTPACNDGCLRAHPDGALLSDAFGSCVTSRCSSVCR